MYIRVIAQTSPFFGVLLQIIQKPKSFFLFFISLHSSPPSFLSFLPSFPFKYNCRVSDSQQSLLGFFYSIIKTFPFERQIWSRISSVYTNSDKIILKNLLTRTQRWVSRAEKANLSYKWTDSKYFNLFKPHVVSAI